MRIVDPLYGEFHLPPGIGQLVMTPEVRRLSQVRLLNTATPTLATLGELRRFSHTLGVLHLCLLHAASHGMGTRERDALLAAVLIHDAGTPPFGHLFEYHLRDILGWNHEDVLRSMLWGYHVSENRAHQVFGGHTIEYRRTLKRLGISFELVEAIVAKKHPLSALLFGTLDFDNLDNVARMLWAAGNAEAVPVAIRLATELSVSTEGRLFLRAATCHEVVMDWLSRRRQIYDLLVFDVATVAAQAVLSRAMAIALKEGALSIEDWTLTDEELLQELLRNPSTKRMISLGYYGTLPQFVFCMQLPGALADYGFSTRDQVDAQLESAVQESVDGATALGYVFIDHGAFEKELTFTDPISHEQWSLGKGSRSVVLYAFAQSGRPVTRGKCLAACKRLLAELGASQVRPLQWFVGPNKEQEDGQLSVDFPA